MDTTETTTDHSHLWPGVPLALASAVLFGASTPFSKLLLGAVDPWLLAGLLYLGAGVGLAIVHFGRGFLGMEAPEAPLRRTDLPWLAAVVISGGMVGPLLLVFGLAHTSAASGALLLNLEGLATMALAWLAFRENVDHRLLLGAAAIIVGAMVLSWRGGGLHVDLGAGLIAGACLAWGVDNNLTRKLSSADPVMIALVKGLIAGSVNIAIALFWRGAAFPAAGVIAGAALVGLLGVGVSLVLFILALRHLGAARTGAYFSLAPFVGAAIALWLLHEPMTAQLGIAAVLMAFGLWTHLTERHAHPHVHEAFAHEHSHVHDQHHQHHDEPARAPHSHWHRHQPLRHAHPHYPDLHHRHRHG